MTIKLDHKNSPKYVKLSSIQKPFRQNQGALSSIKNLDPGHRWFYVTIGSGTYSMVVTCDWELDKKKK